MAKTFEQWLSWMESCHPDEIELGLERCKTVLNQLLREPFKFPVITIAGTNGKGSTVSVLESLAIEAGLSPLVYTSPHILDYRERLTYDGEWLAKELHLETFKAVESARKNLSLTYFEFATLAALKMADVVQPDVLILETGLGGRLDAVNVIQADIAIITTIDFDHEDWLGDTLSKIAREKAGIIHDNTQAVIADNSIPADVMSEIHSRANAVYIANKDFIHSTKDDKWSWQNNQYGPWYFNKPGFPFSNASAAFQAWTLLNIPPVLSEELLVKALSKLRLKGRFQTVRKEPEVILDVAHNPQAFKSLVQRLDEQPCTGKTILVIGMLEDKQILKCIDILGNKIHDAYLCELDTNRSCSLNNLYQYFKDSVMNENQLHCYPKVVDAYQAACIKASSNDRILVTGSFYTIAPVLEYIQDQIE